MSTRKPPKKRSSGVRKNRSRTRNGLRKNVRTPIAKETQIDIKLMLYSPTKARRWDPRGAAPKASPFYTLSMANAGNIDQDIREELLERKEDELGSDFDEYSDLEDMVSDWEDYVDPHPEFEWLEVIDGTVTHRDNSHSGDVARCRAFLIRRNWIGHNFWGDMEEPEEETADLAFELFDRFGCLQPQYKSHPVKQGSGAWGDELNDGDILLINELTESVTHRRRKVGSRLVQSVLDLASRKSKKFICFAWPGILESEVHRQVSESTSNELDLVSARRRIGDAALSFFRQLNFRRIGTSRWLGFSPDDQHPSRLLKANQDFDLPEFERVMDIPDLSVIDELIRCIPTIDDAECIIRLEDIFGDSPQDDRKWKATDDAGDTLLHLASCSSKLRSVQWLMQRSPGLLTQRNASGSTPQEALEACMETRRTIRSFGMLRVVISDNFRGFDDASITCLALLRGYNIEQASDSERNRLKYGCTCGDCVGGFLSPRLRDMLLHFAETTFYFIRILVDGDGENWCFQNKELFEYLPEPIAQSLSTRKDLRIGFCFLWRHLATCVRDKMLPTEENVVRLIRDANEWPPHSRNFIQRGGTISSVATMLFKGAMRHEESYYLFLEDSDTGDLDTVPACRNDREFGMVSGLCGYERTNRVQNVNMSGIKIRY
ncbi:hypothetical protein BJY00DRAFT_254500 [Aspergillus carlsbadensis]|nr:hypothetical protein BJY00DRAFT_254500 [Aspergillus carlsbadensis]